MEFDLGNKLSDIRIISSERSDGPMNFNIDSGSNLVNYLSGVGIDKPLIFPEQTHGSSVAFCTDAGRAAGVDGVLAKDDFVLAVKSADCLPLMLYSKRTGIIGAIHVSRHNLVSGIITKLAEALAGRGTNIAEVLFFFGPHIRSASYPLSEEGLHQISKSPFAKFIGDEKRFDLTAAVKFALEQKGALGENIDDCSLDTFRDERFFSSRLDCADGCQVNVFATIICKK